MPGPPAHNNERLRKFNTLHFFKRHFTKSNLNINFQKRSAKKQLFEDTFLGCF